jgi:hypothetical protein
LYSDPQLLHVNFNLPVAVALNRMLSHLGHNIAF